MRNLSSLQTISTADELIACLSEDPLDRFLKSSCDLSYDDWTDGGSATRADDHVLVVESLRAIGAKTISEWVQLAAWRRMKEDRSRAYHGEIAAVGDPTIRDSWGRIVPASIETLLNEADMGVAGHRVAWGGWDMIYVLPEHPEAKPTPESLDQMEQKYLAQSASCIIEER